MQKPYDVQLELYEKNRINRKINYITGDRNTMPLNISLLVNDSPFQIPENAIIEINFVNRKMEESTDFCTVLNYRQGAVLYEVTDSIIAVDGTVAASVSVESGDMRLTWQGFTFNVTGSLAGREIEPPAYITPWKNAITAKLSEHEDRIVSLEERESIVSNGQSTHFISADEDYDEIVSKLSDGSLILKEI